MIIVITIAHYYSVLIGINHFIVIIYHLIKVFDIDFNNIVINITHSINSIKYDFKYIIVITIPNILIFITITIYLILKFIIFITITNTYEAEDTNILKFNSIFDLNFD